MWFVFALCTVFSWAIADVFYKKGSDNKDGYSHLKIVIMVGFVMGAHAILYMYFQNVSFTFMEMVKYFPVSFLYILSMTVGYVGLRYIELSIASPVQNSSGAITVLLLVVLLNAALNRVEAVGIILISAGIFAITWIEKSMADQERIQSKEKVDAKYRTGVVAITFPILYCIIDGLGTFADAIYLDEFKLIREDSALLAYEFTFFLCALIIYLYLVFYKKIEINFRKEREKGYAAVFETIGQFFYVYAMSEHSVIVAPLVASYSIFSVVFSRIFLKEKLTRLQYIVILFVMIGIALLAVGESF